MVHHPKLVEEWIAKIARTRTTALVVGEPGAGKSIVARALHDRSTRARGPYISVTYPAEIESELFTATIGGTILFEQVDQIGFFARAKLFRILEEREREPFGGNHPQRDVRIIMTSTLELPELKRAGELRGDFLRRLGIVEIAIPPLRERRGDIDGLVSAFVARFSDCHKKHVSISSRAMDVLRAHDWPGNVRQLERTIEHSIQNKDGSIDWSDVSGELPPPLIPRPKVALGDEVHAALQATNGNRSRAARLLGISRRTLYGLIYR